MIIFQEKILVFFSLTTDLFLKGIFGDAQFFPRDGVEIPPHGLQKKASCVGLRRAP